MTVTVRPATPDDLPELVRMGRAFHEASKLAERGLPFDPASLTEFCAYLGRSVHGLCLVGTVDGAVRGAVAGQISPFFLAHNVFVAEEKWWWVDPEARGSGLHARLFTAFSVWARRSGADVVMMAALATLRPAVLDRIYRRMGFKRLEMHYVKGV